MQTTQIQKNDDDGSGSVLSKQARDKIVKTLAIIQVIGFYLWYDIL